MKATIKTRFLACLGLSLALAGAGTHLAAAPRSTGWLIAADTAGPEAASRAGLPTAAAVGNPLQRGPYAVSADSYSFGNEFFTGTTGLPGMAPDQGVECTAYVKYPQNLAGGPYPLVVFLHGQHGTTYEGSVPKQNWPPLAGQRVIENHMGYAYLMDHLASHGYVCISISANGINAGAPGAGILNDWGNTARAQLLQVHMFLWKMWNLPDFQFTDPKLGTLPRPFGNRFAGRVDTARVGVFGHSRGGEGAVWNYGYNQGLPASLQVGVKAVLAVAPTNFNRKRANGVPLGVILPYCDGDVFDQQGVHFYDDARYSAGGDMAPKHTFLMMGANHNFFNTVWSPSSGIPHAGDDWYDVLPEHATDPDFGQGAGTRKLDESRQRQLSLAYTTAFFRTYLGGVGGSTAFGPLLNSEAPSPVPNTEVYASYHPPDNMAYRRDVNKVDDVGDLHNNDLRGKVTTRGISTYLGAGGPAPMLLHVNPESTTGEWTPHQPHTTISTNAKTLRGLGQAVIGFSGASTDVRTAPEWKNELPANVSDVSRYSVLQFRVGVNYKDARNAPGEAQDFLVALSDDRYTVYQPVANWTKALFYPPGSRTGTAVPKVTLNTVRIPLWAFAGLELDKIRSARFMFARRSSGAFVVSDVQFADPTVTQRGKIQVRKQVNFRRVKRKSLVKKSVAVKNVSPNENLVVRIQPPTPNTNYFLVVNGQLVTADQVGVIPPSGSVSLDVLFRPTSKKRYAGTLPIFSSDVDSPVKLVGRGR